MVKRLKFNLDKVQKEMFENSTDNIYDKFEEEEQILEKCKEYEGVEYPIKLKFVNDDGAPYWIAEHPDLPGCMTHGESKVKALENLDDAKRTWIYGQLAAGEQVPLPSIDKMVDECSGKVLLRLPKELHFNLIKKAEKDQTSLNQEILYLISHGLGKDSVQKQMEVLMDKLQKLIHVNSSTNIDKAFDNISDFLAQYKDEFINDFEASYKKMPSLKTSIKERKRSYRIEMGNSSEDQAEFYDMESFLNQNENNFH